MSLSIGVVIQAQEHGSHDDQSSLVVRIQST
jgi:hypothetical protein